MRAGIARSQLGILQRAHGFRLLFLAAFGSSFGTWLAYVALVVDVYARTHDSAWVSALLLAEFVPVVAAGLLAGPLIDRLSRKRLLVASDLIRAAVFCALPFATDALQIVLLALVAGVATSVFRPASYAGLPLLVAEADEGRANGLLQSAENFSWAVGSLVGGIVIAASTVHVAYWVNAASFAISAVLISSIRERLEEERELGRARWHDLFGGFALVRTSSPFRTVLVAWSIGLFACGAVNVAEIALAKSVFHAGSFGYGLLVATTAVGLVGGSLVAGGLLERRGMRVVYVAAIALMAIGWGAAAAAPDVWVAAVLVVIAGLGNGAAVVYNVMLVQRGAADVLRGRALTVAMSVTSAFFAAGTIAAGPATNHLGARTVWAAAAVLFALASAAAALLLRRAPLEALRAMPEEDPQTVGETQFLAKPQRAEG